MFPYKRAILDYGFEFVHDIESINLSFVIQCFLVGVGFLSHGDLGVWFITDFANGIQLSLKITFIV